MRRGLVICPCHKWHLIHVFVTETYKHRFRCGLRVVLEPGLMEFKFRGESAKITQLVSGESLVIFLTPSEFEGETA